MNQTVSILMPSYNYERYIRKAIESVLNQTYQYWELIIVDDGSSDSSVDLIKEYKDRRIFLYTQKNKGVTQTINRAFKLSKGELICFLDADDYYHPKKLEEQVAMINSGYDLVTTKVSAVDEKGRDSDDKFFNLWWNTYEPKIIFGKSREFKFFNGNYLCKSAVMLKRDLFQKYGMFNTKLITAYDLELWIRILPNIKIERIDKILTFYRWHGLNETVTNTLRMRTEILLVYDKYLDSLKISMNNQSEKVKNFALSFSYLIRTQGLQDAYVALQVLKKNSDLLVDTFDILLDKRYLSIINMTINQKDTSYAIVKDGQNKNIEKIMKETYL